MKTNTNSKTLVNEALSSGNFEEVKKLFFNEEVSDDDLFENKEYAGKVLRAYIGLSGQQSLKGKCFIGVNVKTSSSEDLKPISFRTTEDSIKYVANPSFIADGGRITEMDNPLQELGFWWDPGQWSFEEEKQSGEYGIGGGYAGAVVSSLDNKDFGNGEVIEMFKSPYGRGKYNPQLGLYDPEKNEGNKFNILGDIYYNALKISGPCWVWIYHLDFDIDNDGKYLSFVLAMGDKREDLDTLMGVKKKSEGNTPQQEKEEGVKIEYPKSLDETPRNKLINYILLVKARYVRKLERQRQKESVKSAVAAIMSRNMSHNLGSHYLYYTKMQLAALANEHEFSGPDIRGAAKVLGYMQARMDYLATIVSDDKYPYGGVFFKGQIFDELTIDDFSKRHFQGTGSDGKERKYRRTTNYLLQNLILSENFTRGPVIDGAPSLLEEKKTEMQAESKNDSIIKRKNIRLQIRIDSGTYTGSPDDVQIFLENDTKLEISKISIALPGSIMSIHAFFNVVENIIRNSAKYKKDDFGDELVITIAIKELTESQPNRYQVVIYDNKRNALKEYSTNNTKRLVDQMNNELGMIQILNEKNELDKSSKGLKEMLFSILWMRAYTYDRTEKLSDILAQLDREKDPKAKMDEIKRHAFEYVAVFDDGKSEWKMYEPDENNLVQVDEADINKPYNLGVCFELPKWRMLENLDATLLNDDVMKEKGVNNFTDIRCFDASRVEKKTSDKLKAVFTRIYDGGLVENDKNDKQALEIMKKVLAKRFTDINDYRIGMDTEYEKGFPTKDEEAAEKKRHGIYFKSHESDLASMEKYAYCEAISGENFTKTMQNIFNDSLIKSDEDQTRANDSILDEQTNIKETSQKGLLSRIFGKMKKTEEDEPKTPLLKTRKIGDFKDDASEFFALKIKESALTRITLVDERLFNDMEATQNKREILKHKNIRILNLKSEMQESSIVTHDGALNVKEMFDCSDFRDDKDATHFLSIHLGMIEKIVKEDSGWVKANHLCEVTVSERVDKLMDMLKKTFRTDQGELFISIHSGRGNFSKELDESLSDYPFISISAIENVYANSKFLLAQLFYDTVYIGKGELNKISKKEDNNG